VLGGCWRRAAATQRCARARTRAQAPHPSITRSPAPQVWDARQMRAPLAVAEVGGGVWKLKWRAGSCADCGEDEQLLAACMYNGAAVYRVAWSGGGGGGGGGDGDAAQASLERRAHYLGHGEGALVYGVEWLPADSSAAAAAPARVISAAFYHKTVHVWGAERDGI